MVVEGVETREQLEVVRDLECEYAQGWLFAKAMAAGEVGKTLELPDSILAPLRNGGSGLPALEP